MQKGRLGVIKEYLAAIARVAFIQTHLVFQLYPFLNLKAIH